jgi:hypothetical protein
MLPISNLYSESSSADDLFDSLKANILLVCNQENVLKIGKLISIGFKRSSLEAAVV